MKKQINYKVSGEEWNNAKDKAFSKLVKKAKVDGFREGKVPRNIFEKKYGTGDIISTAMEDMVDKKYREVVISEKLVPVVEPKLEIVSADDNGFEVNMTFILDPEVKLGKYKELKVKKDTVKVTKEEINHEVGHILDPDLSSIKSNSIKIITSIAESIKKYNIDLKDESYYKKNLPLELEDFIVEFIDKLHWRGIIECQSVSESFITSYSK